MSETKCECSTRKALEELSDIIYRCRLMFNYPDEMLTRIQESRAALSAPCPCERDYADMRTFQAKFIAADQECLRLQTEMATRDQEVASSLASAGGVIMDLQDECKRLVAERDRLHGEMIYYKRRAAGLAF